MKRKRLYGARLTIAGLHSPSPIRLKYDPFSDTYIGLDGEIMFSGINDDKLDDDIDFVSSDINEVRTWLAGVKSTLRMVNKWSNVPLS
jgi:hypothetical protein